MVDVVAGAAGSGLGKKSGVDSADEKDDSVGSFEQVELWKL